MSSISRHVPALLKQERQGAILESLQRDGKIHASELSARLKVSEDTIRRDLRDLAREHKLMRVHGGALPRSPVAGTFAERRSQSVAAKSAIGQAAAKLIEDGQVVFMDGGTTTLQAAAHIPPGRRATIVTNSPPLAIALAGHERVEVMLLGGRFSKPSQVTLGAATVAELLGFRAALCILGVCSLHPQAGLTVPDFEEAQIKRAMIAQSEKVAGLVSAEKLGTALPYVVAPAALLHYLITDSSSSVELAAYKAMGISVISV